MWALERPSRGDSTSALVDERTHPIGIVGVPGDQHVKIVRQTD
ncbi:MAG: hypothetical protein K0S56_1392 [Microvirga sp.]|nr:hypothetical protein [Microvirga sp.]